MNPPEAVKHSLDVDGIKSPVNNVELKTLIDLTGAAQWALNSTLLGTQH